jgi:hypothetical protein
MDIMENQGAALADRPHNIAAAEIFSGGQGLTLTPFGEKFRQKRRFAGCKLLLNYCSTNRRALHTHLQPKAAEAYQPLLMSRAKNLVLDILGDPHNFQNHVISYALSVMTVYCLQVFLQVFLRRQ